MGNVYGCTLRAYFGKPNAQACPPVGSAAGETVEGFIRKSDLSCSAVHDGYIRLPYDFPPSHTFRIDIHATAGGTCTLRTYDGVSQQCIFASEVTPNPQNRGIVSMRADVMTGPGCSFPPCNIPPIMWPVDGNNQVTNQHQDVDSRASGSDYNDAVPIWIPVYTGTYSKSL